MKTNPDFLSSLLKTAQLGQTDIRSVLDTSICPSLRKTLEMQLQEYDSIESEAHSLAAQRGWEVSELEPALRFFMDRRSRIKLTGGNTESKIADILIRSNTRGMIKGLKALHQSPIQDQQLQILSQKLLDCENAHIRQMQAFL